MSYWHSEDWLFFCCSAFLLLQSVILKQHSLLLHGCLIYFEVFDQKFCWKSFGNPDRLDMLDHPYLCLCLAFSKNSTKFLSPEFFLQKQWWLLPESSRSSIVISLHRFFTNCSVHILSLWNYIFHDISESFIYDSIGFQYSGKILSREHISVTNSSILSFFHNSSVNTTWAHQV